MKRFILIALLVSCQKDIEETETVQNYAPRTCSCECDQSIAQWTIDGKVAEGCASTECSNDSEYRSCVYRAMIEAEIRHGMKGISRQ